MDNIVDVARPPQSGQIEKKQYMYVHGNLILFSARQYFEKSLRKITFGQFECCIQDISSVSKIQH